MTALEAVRKTKAIWKRKAKSGSSETGGCPLCRYRDDNRDDCSVCPYFKKFSWCLSTGSPYQKWCFTTKPEERKKCALEIVAQLEELERCIKEEPNVG